jgi:DtxR family Mn-dependent transcriptional regulator
MEASHSESIEMYLKSVAELDGIRTPVPIGRVAERMGVTSVSANEMMKRLAAEGLIRHQPYKGVLLTGEGRELANSVIRRQRLWECFLVDKLELDWARSHELACDLEHATAVEVAAALAEYLGHPTHCPHGNPIPGPGNEVEGEPGVPLSSLAVGQVSRITAIKPERPEVMSYLQDRGLLPRQKIEVMEIAPLEGPITVRLDDKDVVLGVNLASLVLVDEVEQV